jgi:hypothetical protein
VARVLVADVKTDFDQAALDLADQLLGTRERLMLRLPACLPACAPLPYGIAVSSTLPSHLVRP